MTIEDLKGITGIGPRITKKIEEILKTGRIFDSIWFWYSSDLIYSLFFCCKILGTLAAALEIKQ